jgi:TP901 family phage tail tape measure protein
LFVDVRANVSGAVAGLKATQGQLTATAAAAKRMDAAMLTSGSTTKKVGASYAATGAAASSAAAAQTGAAAASTKAATSASKLGKAGSSAKAGLAGMGMGAMGAQVGVAALAYGVGKVAKTAIDFDASMRNVNSIAQLSEGRFKSLRGSVLSLAGPTAQTPQTLANGLYDLVSSGFAADDALGVLSASAKAATAGLTTTEVSTAAVAAVLNAYQMPASQAGKVSDTLFKTVDRGVISFEQLANNIGDVLPFASSLGVGLDQVGASISTMTKGGNSPAETMTRIKATMTALIAPSDALKARMAKLGFTAAQSMLKAKGFQGSIDMLARSTGGSKEELAKLFPNVRALGGVMALTGNKAKAASKDVAEFAKTAGATDKALSQQKQSTRFKFNEARANAQALAVTLGTQLRPALDGAAVGLSTLTSSLNDLASSAVGNQVMTGLGKGLGLLARQMPNAVKSIMLPVTNLTSIPSRLAGLPGQLGGLASGIGRAFDFLQSKIHGGASAKGLGTLKGLDGKSYSIKIDADNRQALSKTAGTKRGLDSIPGIKTTRIRVTSDADIVATKIRTALTRAAKPIKIKTEFDRRGNAATVVTQAKPIKVTADTSAAKAKATQFVQTVNGLRPKPAHIRANNSQAQTAINQTIQSLANIHDKNVSINVRTNKIGGKASGGYASGLAEVNERGPESARLPGGQIAMLGDGRRQVMALPNGSYVYTAAQTRKMFGDIAHYKGGGPVRPKHKKGEKQKDYNRRVKDWQSRYNTWANRQSSIKDYRSDAATARIPLVDGQVNQIAADQKALARANRHLKEARKLKGPERKEAIERAKAEIAQAAQTLAIDQAREAQESQQALADAIKQHTEALKANSDELAKNREFATSVHTATKGVTDTLLQGVMDKSIGGQLSSWLLTSGAGMVT